MTSLRRQASWAKMMSLREKLIAPACHPTKFVKKAEYRTFLSANIGATEVRHIFNKPASGATSIKLFTVMVRTAVSYAGHLHTFLIFSKKLKSA
jgi:hypothetical protein